MLSGIGARSNRILPGINSVETHLDFGDLLAYDVTVSAEHSSLTNKATGSETNASTIAISQAGGINNASCVM